MSTPSTTMPGTATKPIATAPSLTYTRTTSTTTLFCLVTRTHPGSPTSSGLTMATTALHPVLVASVSSLPALQSAVRVLMARILLLRQRTTTRLGWSRTMTSCSGRTCTTVATTNYRLRMRRSTPAILVCRPLSTVIRMRSVLPISPSRGVRTGLRDPSAAVLLRVGA